MSATEQQLFKEIKLQNKPLAECELVYKSPHDNNRLYVIKAGTSFWAQAVSFYSCSPDADAVNEDYWLNPSLEVETLFELIAYHDGVRHLFWHKSEPNTEEDGYIYYPEIPILIKLLQKVRELELEICPDTPQ